ncbi:transmembrane protein 144b isoform X2 [Clupea harengus]|uniref:Transmembrane protein 144b isoform X2 n=1 Tax=Clupea harengus TaxID=7950 RepID=A0A6P8FM82_CLUHA|nr:transmembrane protein 144b isoform X2 [Clupea harengus]
MTSWGNQVLSLLTTPGADQSGIAVAANGEPGRNVSDLDVELPWPPSGEVLGFIGCMVAAVFYGSQFVPVKKVETGDGVFFQWVNCLAIWLVGFLGDQLLHSPAVHPFTMLGGAIWATGNITAVPIVKTIGLGLGVLLWGSSGLLIGWASSRFGWFGIGSQDVPRPLLNYCGAALCLFSSCMFVCVKSDLQPCIRTSPILENSPLLTDRLNSDLFDSSGTWPDNVSPKYKRLLGCSLAILAGIFYGCSFVPVLYIKNQASNNASIFVGASLNDIEYCFAQYNGIFLTSTIYFLVYCVVMKNRPRIYPRSVLPAVFSGTIWGIATYSWFMANTYLNTVITFPIVSAGYSLVAALWGGVVFKEVRGLANCLVFVLAATMVLTGTVLTALSKIWA